MGADIVFSVVVAFILGGLASVIYIDHTRKRHHNARRIYRDENNLHEGNYRAYGQYVDDWHHNALLHHHHYHYHAEPVKDVRRAGTRSYFGSKDVILRGGLFDFKNPYPKPDDFYPYPPEWNLWYNAMNTPYWKGAPIPEHEFDRDALASSMRRRGYKSNSTVPALSPPRSYETEQQALREQQRLQSFRQPTPTMMALSSLPTTMTTLSPPPAATSSGSVTLLPKKLAVGGFTSSFLKAEPAATTPSSSSLSTTTTAAAAAAATKPTTPKLKRSIDDSDLGNSTTPRTPRSSVLEGSRHPLSLAEICAGGINTSGEVTTPVEEGSASKKRRAKNPLSNRR